MRHRDTQLQERIAASEAQIKALREPLQRELSAANRAAAAKNRAIGGPNELSADERLQTSRDLLLGSASQEDLHRRVSSRELNKADLQRIARSHTSEGYDVDFTSKTTIKDLIPKISEANKQYDQAGQATYHNLETSGKKVATLIDKGTAALLHPIVVAMAAMGKAEEAALATILRDRAGGGTGVATQTRSGQNINPQYPQRGSGFGGASDQLVTEAEATLKAFYRRIGQDARDASFKTVQEILAKNPNYNFFSKKLDAGIQGSGDTAKASRTALNQLRDAALKLDAGLSTASMSPEARAALTSRQARGQAYVDERDARRNATFETSAGQALIGAGTGLGSGLTNAYLTRLLPGLRQNKDGVLRPGPDSKLTPADMVPLNDAFSRFLAALAQRGRVSEDIKKGGAPATPEQERQLGAADSVTAVRQSQVFDAYDKVHQDAALNALETRQLSADTALDKKKYAAAQERIRQTTLPTGSREIDTLGYGKALGYNTSVREYGLGTQADAVVKEARAARGGTDDPQAAVSRAEARVKQAAQLIEALGKEELANAPKIADKLGRLSESLARDLQNAISRAQKRIVNAEKQLADPANAAKPVVTDRARASILAARDQISQAQANLGRVAVPRTTASGALFGRTVRGADELLPKHAEAVFQLDKAFQAAARSAIGNRLAPGYEQDYRAKRQAILDKNAAEQSARTVPVGPGGTVLQSVSALRPAAESIHAYAVQLAAEVKAVQAVTKEVGARNGRVGAAAAGGGAGRVPPPIDTVPGAGRGGVGGERAVLEKILTQLGAIHGTLKGGLKVTAGRAGETSTFRGVESARDLALGNANASRTATAAPRQYSTQAGREAFFGGTGQSAEIQEILAGERNVAQAAALVTRQVLTQTQAQTLYRGALGLSTAEAKKFAEATKVAVNDTELAARAEQGVVRAAAEAGMQARRQAAEQANLAAATARVSTAVQREIALLRELNSAGHDQAAISAQQIYGLLDAELAKQGLTHDQRRANIGTTLNEAGPEVSPGELSNIGRSSRLQAESSSAGAQSGQAFGSGMGAAGSSARVASPAGSVTPCPRSWSATSPPARCSG